MAKRMLNQTGIMRVLWRLLKEREGGSITLTEQEINMPNPNDAIAIIHNERANSYTLRLVKAPVAKKSNILIQGMN